MRAIWIHQETREIVNLDFAILESTDSWICLSNNKKAWKFNPIEWDFWAYPEDGLSIIDTFLRALKTKPMRNPDNI